MSQLEINLTEALLLHEVSPSPETVPEEHREHAHTASRELCLNIGSALVDLMVDPKPDKTVTFSVSSEDLWFLRDHLSAGLHIEGLHLERDGNTGLPVKMRKSGLFQVGGDRFPTGTILLAKIYSEILREEGKLGEEWSLQDILGE